MSVKKERENKMTKENKIIKITGGYNYEPNL
jgi:hypothetical protein